MNHNFAIYLKFCVWVLEKQNILEYKSSKEKRARRYFSCQYNSKDEKQHRGPMLQPFLPVLQAFAGIGHAFRIKSKILTFLLSYRH